LHVENGTLRQAIEQLESEINRLKAENAKLKIRPYDEAQRQAVTAKLKSYSDTERDLLRFLLERGETGGSLIYEGSQDGAEICRKVLERLGRDGMIKRREDPSRPNLVRLSYYGINVTFESALRDLLYPRDSQASPRFVI